MSLHKKHDSRRKASDVIYASTDLSLSVPKNKIPRTESSPRTAYGLIHDELLLDGNSRQNLATFCTTSIEPEVQSLMAECIDKNMCDKDEYPQTAEIESRCVHILADLWNSPAASRTIGCSTTGSSEAALLGGLALKWRWREKRKAAGKPADKPNLVTGPVQVCGYTGTLTYYAKEASFAGATPSALPVPRLPLYAEIRLTLDKTNAVLIGFNYQNSGQLDVFADVYNSLSFPFPLCEAPAAPTPTPGR